MTVHPGAPRGITAIAVDDDPMMLLILDRVFQRLDVRLIHCRSGLGLEQLLVAYLPELVLIDVRMPDIEGPALVKRIRQHSRREVSGAVVLLHSALSEDEIRVLVRHSGADSFIRKGIAVSALTEELRGWVGEAGQRRAAAGKVT